MSVNIFSIVPVEVCLDKRLTLEQMRVLITLLSFRNKNTDTMWPTRKQISERCGMHESNISAATTALVNLGWLVKDGCGGFSKASRYRITVPETIAESATSTVAEQDTVAQSATVAEQATPTLADSATRMPLADSATRKEQTNLQTNGTDKDTRARKPEILIDGVSQQVAKDYLAVRKAKKAGALTVTALDGLKREASKVGYTLEQVLVVCCERNWVGFKAEWLERDQKQAGVRTQDKSDHRRQTTEAAKQRLFGNQERDVSHEAAGL